MKVNTSLALCIAYTRLTVKVDYARITPCKRQSSKNGEIKITIGTTAGMEEDKSEDDNEMTSNDLDRRLNAKTQAHLDAR